MASDPFSTTSGLIDHYTGTVIESWFGINPSYNADLHLLFWKVQLDNPDEFPEVEDGIIQEQFTIGPKWESMDGGETVEYPNKPEARFNANTQYGKIINRAVDEWGLREELGKRGASPAEARIWAGLRFEFQSQQLTKPFKNAKGELIEPGPKVMPVDYLGQGEEVVYERAFDIGQLGLSEEEAADLRGAAEASDSYGEFLDKAMKLQWVSGNASMVTALADQSLWQGLRLL